MRDRPLRSFHHCLVIIDIQSFEITLDSPMDSLALKVENLVFNVGSGIKGIVSDF